MTAVDALFELRVDVHRHLRVGVADLSHDPLDVESVGEQRDGDVGTTHGVRGRVGQRRQPARRDLLAGQLGRLLDDLADALATDPAAAEIGHEVRIGRGRVTEAAQAVEVLDDGLDRGRGHLDLTDAGLGLRVGDAEPGTGRVVQSHLADLEIGQLAGTDTAAAEDLDDHSPARVATPVAGDDPADVVADGRFGDAEPAGDLLRRHALCQEAGDQRGGDAERLVQCGHRRPVLLGGGVEHRCQLVHLEERPPRLGHADRHPSRPRRVGVDVAVLDRLVEDRRQTVDQLAQRRRPERHRPTAAVIANVGARIDRLTQLTGLAELGLLEALTKGSVDLVERVLREERQQMRPQPPGVIALARSRERHAAQRAVLLGLQPPGGVLVKRRGGRFCLVGLRGLRSNPHAGPDPRENIAKLVASGGFGPAAATTARASGSLVQHDPVAPAHGPDAQLERARAVGELADVDGACAWTSHLGTSEKLTLEVE